jgi:hypothetical protein
MEADLFPRVIFTSTYNILINVSISQYTNSGLFRTGVHTSCIDSFEWRAAKAQENVRLFKHQKNHLSELIVFRWQYILIWVIVCFVVGGSVIFVLMPRTVTLSSDIRVISIVNVTKTDNATRQFIDFNFVDKLNVSSGNYLPISIINVSATIVSKFQPWSVDQVSCF